MTWHLAGQIALNLSMLLYSLMYWPQLYHNRDHHHLEQMSFAFHSVLFTSVAMDLYYTIGYLGQWQCVVVDLAFWTLLLIQHIQRLRITRDPKVRLQHHILLGLMVLLSLGSLMVQWYAWSRSFCDMMGWASNIGYASCGIPQILRNLTKHEADAISLWYLAISMLSSLLDGFCAWTLHWGTATRYGFILPIFIMMILYWQNHLFHHSTKGRLCIGSG